MVKKITEVVKNIDGEMKIRDYLKHRMGFSTSLIAKVKYDNVFLCGTPVHMRAMVKEGDIIEIYLPNEASENIPPIEMPLDIIYEDDMILAVNKPRNMPVHPSKGNHLPTLANGVAAYINAPFVFRAVNRLDRDTSGIVLIAKNQPVGARLCEQMKKSGFRKKYYAIVSGTPEVSAGVIDAPIKRLAEGDIRRVVAADGKECKTEYKVLDTYDDGSSLCEITPLTGRTHQIRVHMAYIGHPLVNDFLYGERQGDETYRLHCGELSFLHPKSGESTTLKCLPDWFSANK